MEEFLRRSKAKELRSGRAMQGTKRSSRKTKERRGSRP